MSLFIKYWVCAYADKLSESNATKSCTNQRTFEDNHRFSLSRKRQNLGWQVSKLWQGLSYFIHKYDISVHWSLKHYRNNLMHYNNELSSFIEILKALPHRDTATVWVCVCVCAAMEGRWLALKEVSMCRLSSVQHYIIRKWRSCTNSSEPIMLPPCRTRASPVLNLKGLRRAPSTGLKSSTTTSKMPISNSAHLQKCKTKESFTPPCTVRQHLAQDLRWAQK